MPWNAGEAMVVAVKCKPARLPEEMANDDLILADIESAIGNGQVRRRFSRDPRGTRYEVVGPATDRRQVAVICRIKATGKLLFITTYLLD